MTRAHHRALPTVVGTSHTITLTNGKRHRVVLLNNAATTPPLKVTLSAVNRFLQTYGTFHRGSGPHANITYRAVQEGLQTIRVFLGLRKDQILLFTQNTSAAINLFIRLLKLRPTDVILTSELEHTSNNLPWKFNSRAKVATARVFDDGSLDYDDLETSARTHRGHVKLIAVTGASNMTGYVPDIARLASLAKRSGALLFIDAAQLAPHRPIDMKKQRIDALAFSAHKVYAPFGLGVLALPTALLETGPVDPGGGSIDMVNERNVVWAPATVRHQTGTWNVTGIVAMAASCKALMEVGWPALITHERQLVRYAISRLKTVPGIITYVPWGSYSAHDRIGTITFNLLGYHHSLLSAILEHEHGIETRAGTICNHRLVRRWHNIPDSEQHLIERRIASGDRLATYGIVRVSFGLHNTKRDIDELVTALRQIAEDGPALKYARVPYEEIYIPRQLDDER